MSNFLESVVKNKLVPAPSTDADVNVIADGTSLLLSYDTEQGKAIINYKLVSVFTFGRPNDEVLEGHRLYERGLDYYAAQIVQNSRWIRELDVQNSGHSQHDSEKFIRSHHHHILTFKDATFECIYSNIFGDPEVSIVSVENWRKELSEYFSNCIK
ncbi:hypothetical protein [Hoeflea sp. TYP-13]|uniref:hypothetical protein n=1 Tax=Hoeflea sp. TYP-13 TaxID=3230023 RepID=UPI0034C6271D